MTIKGSRSDDNLAGTSDDDIFNMIQGGDDTVGGGGGNDIFRFGNALTAADQIDGGTGIDRVAINGDSYAAGLVFGAATMTNVEQLYVASGHSYNLTFDDANIAAGKSLTVIAGSLGATDQLTIDGSAELDGRFIIRAGAGDDVLTGGAQGDVFHLEHGGNDTVHGGGGTDMFYVGANLNGSDVIDGGTGTDTILLDGDYAGHGFVPITGVTNVETLEFADGHSYLIASADANVAAGQILTIEALNNANVIFNGTAETDGAFHFIVGPTASCGFEGGDGNDVYDDMSSTLYSSFYGNGGDDVANLGGNFRSGQIFGGSGYNIVTFDGDYSGTLNIFATSFDQINKVVFYGGHSYADVYMGDIGATNTSTVEVDASALLSTDTFSFRVNATGTHYDVTAGAGTSTITTGSASDIIDVSAAANATVTGAGGADTIIGGAGFDNFYFYFAGQSTSTGYDTVENVDFSHDLFKVSNFVPSAIDTAVSAGALSTANFDINLSAAIGTGQLGSHEAVLFTPDSGTLSGHTFLIVDINGTAGYQASADLVVDITGYAGALTTGDFI